MEYIGFIDEETSNSELYGRKGSTIIEMANIGLNVPPGFIINTKSYKLFLQESKFQDEIFEILSKEYHPKSVINISSKIKDLFLSSNIPKKIISEIRKAFHKVKEILGENPSFAVRSSANIEDSENFSFAGQAESFLNTKNLEEIMLSIRKCWASLFSPQALLYILHMKKMGVELSLLDIEIAVIIQKMINPDASGVLFTANVINNNLGEMMINSTWGLGDTITNNAIIPDVIILNKKNATILTKIIGEKEKKSVLNPEGSSTILIDMDDNLKKICSLNQLQLNKLYHLGLKLEKCMKYPQDIEWAIENDILYALQSRSITTLDS